MIFKILRQCSLFLFFLFFLACSREERPFCCESTGEVDVPAVPSFNFSFKTGLQDFPLITALGNLKAITESDLKNLLQAANITHQPGLGIISGQVVSNDGFFQPNVFISIRNASGKEVGDLFYNGLGDVPDFSNVQGTTENGGFTVFNLPPGPIFLTADQGGRGSQSIEIFPNVVSQVKFVVVPLPIEKIPITGFIINSPTKANVPNAGIVLYGSSELLTTSTTGGAYRVEEFSPERFFLVRVFASQFYNTYQGLQTGTSELNVTIAQSFTPPRPVPTGNVSTSSLTGPTDLTRDFQIFSRQYINDLVQPVGVVLDPSKGIITGRVRSDDGTGILTFQVQATNDQGDRIGDIFYLTLGGGISPKDPLSNPEIFGTSRYFIFNLPVGPVFLHTKATITGANQAFPSKYSGGLVSLSIADSVFEEDITALFLQDPEQANVVVPYSLGLRGRVLKLDGLTSVTGANVTVLGVPPDLLTYTPFELVCGQSSLAPINLLSNTTDTIGNFSIPINSDCDESYPIPAASSRVIHVSPGPNIAPGGGGLRRYLPGV